MNKSIISTIINIILDIILVCYLRLGIPGAAFATLISQLVSGPLCGIFAYRTNPYFKLKKGDFSFSFEMSYKILRLGVPLSLQFGLIAISTMAVQRIVNSFGTIVVASFTATNRIEQLIHQPYTTLGASLATFCGQNYGAKRNDRVYSGYKTAIVIMALFTLLLIAVMQLFSIAIAGMFVSDQSVITLSALGLRITSLFYPALGMIYVIRGVLSGVGDAFFALLNGIIEIIGRFTIPLLFAAYLGFGEKGIWISARVVWALSAFTAWLRYIDYSRRKVSL